MFFYATMHERNSEDQTKQFELNLIDVPALKI